MKCQYPEAGVSAYCFLCHDYHIEEFNACKLKEKVKSLNQTVRNE